MARVARRLDRHGRARQPRRQRAFDRQLVERRVDRGGEAGVKRQICNPVLSGRAAVSGARARIEEARSMPAKVSGRINQRNPDPAPAPFPEDEIRAAGALCGRNQRSIRALFEQSVSHRPAGRRVAGG